jgi:hypothetical protein
VWQVIDPLQIFSDIETAKMPFVPENILKKRRTAEEFKAKRDDDVANRAPKASKDKSEMIKRAETYVAEYKALENDTIRLRRVSKGSGSRHAPEESKLAFVVRIRGKFYHCLHPFFRSKHS